MQCKTLLNYIKCNFTLKVLWAVLGVAQWIKHGLRTMLPIRFPARAHVWVPHRGCVKGNSTLMLLSLSFSLPSSISKNKKIKSF